VTTRQRWTLVATIIGSGIVFLDGTIVNVALPRIGRDLPASVIGTLEGQNYVVSGYLAILAALLILAGALSDHFGRRRVFAIGLGSFGATSVLCGLAPTLELLVVFRLLQGAAGAFLVPGSLSIITQAFEGAERARAFGMWASATSGLVLVGPILGGVLVDTIGWPIGFLINVPFIAAALWAARHIEESRDSEAGGHFDWLGSVVATVAVGGLAFGAIRGQEQAWSDPVAWIALGVGALALVVFPFLMARRRHPLVPLGLFRERGFATINLATFFIYGALYITQANQGLLFQNVLGYTATAAGVVGLPTAIMLVLLSTRIGTIAGRIGARPFLVAGPLIMAAGLLWLARVPASSAGWQLAVDDPATYAPSADVLTDILPAMVLFGLGIACVVAPLTSTLMNSIPSRQAGLGSAINNAISRVGAPLVGALIFIAISATFYSILGSLAGLDASAEEVRQVFQPLNAPRGEVSDAELAAARQASVDAFHQAMIVSAGLLVAGAVVSWIGLRDGAAAGAGHGTEAAEGRP
jgi:EmrB/QacA subfamily drug resistance transporter